MDKTIKSMRDAFNMTKQRCYNENNRDYKYYGGRGIVICDRWLLSFDNFVADMGIRPEGMTLERKDNDGPYSPDNCEWASRKNQMKNTRVVKLITWQGETMSISDWERKLGWKAGTLKARLGTLNYSIEEAFTKPIKYGGLVPNKQYGHLNDKSWRNTTAMHAVKRKRSLSDDAVIRMRSLHATVAANYSLLAKYFSVSIETASDAVQGLKSYSLVT